MQQVSALSPRSASYAEEFRRSTCWAALAARQSPKTADSEQTAMNVKFEWDERKAASNLKKHRVSFSEASTIFDDLWFITFLDEEHSTGEDRYITIGLSNRNRLLLVAHTDWDGETRIISARKATNNEREFYEEGL